MSVKRIAWALEQSTGSVTRKAVLFVLADHENGHTGRCDPLISTIARTLEIHERTVERALSDLCEAGLISRTRKHRADGSLAGYSYVFLDDTAPGRPGTESGRRPGTESAHEPEVNPNRSDLKAKASKSARSELIPLPGMVDPDAALSREVTEDGAQELVGRYIDQLKAIGSPAPKRLVGQVARHVGEFVREGIDAAVIARALELLVERRLNPASLPALIPEAAAGQRQLPRPAADAYRNGDRQADNVERRPPPPETLEHIERVIGRPVAGVLKGVDK